MINVEWQAHKPSKKEILASRTERATKKPTEMSRLHTHLTSVLFSLRSFLRCTFSHQHTKQSPPVAASAALSYTSSMVNSTWKEKHHVVLLDARFIQILTRTQESWKMSFNRCFSPLSSSTLVARVWNSRGSSNKLLPHLPPLLRQTYLYTMSNSMPLLCSMFASNIRAQKPDQLSKIRYSSKVCQSSAYQLPLEGARAFDLLDPLKKLNELCFQATVSPPFHLLKVYVL